MVLVCTLVKTLICNVFKYLPNRKPIIIKCSNKSCGFIDLTCAGMVILICTRNIDANILRIIARNALNPRTKV